MRLAARPYLDGADDPPSSRTERPRPQTSSTADPRTAAKTAGRSSAGAGIRCIVVDDDPGVLDLIRIWLEELGIEVRSSRSALEANDLAGREDYHLIVTDVVMEGMDGIELMRHLRKLPKRPKVIGITGVADGENLGRVMQTLGAEGFLMKPFRREDLVGALEKALGRKLG